LEQVEEETLCAKRARATIERERSAQDDEEDEEERIARLEVCGWRNDVWENSD
jgi:hypothetical protein